MNARASLDHLFETKSQGIRRRRRTWDEESIRKVASQYKRVTDFFHADQSAYSVALRHGWLPAIKRDFFTQGLKPKTLQDMIDAARQYRTPKEWREQNTAAYATTRGRGWLDDVINTVWGNQRWTEEEVRERASQYPSLNHWHKADQTAYMQARRKGWLDRIKTDYFPNAKYPPASA